MENPFKKVDPSQFAQCWQDVAYADEDSRQVVDIYLPEGEGPFPLVVFVHGGGWVSGDRRENTMPGMFKLPTQGYAVAFPEYRLVPDVRWPEPFEDVRACIRFLRAHAAEYKLKADKIAIMGNSAGGHLANMVAAMGGRPMMQGARYGNLDQSDAVQCLVSIYAPTDLYTCDLADRTTKEDQALATGGMAARGDTGEPGMWQPHNQLMGFRCLENPQAAAMGSPMQYVTKDFPPAYYLHGIADQVVPYAQSVAMVKQVNYVCGEERAKLRLFDGALHGDPVMKTNEVMEDILDFIDEHLWEGVHERTPLPADSELKLLAE